MMMIWWSSPSSPSEKVRRSVWKLASRRRRRGPKMPEPWRCDANENCQPGWSWWLWQLLLTQTRFINIGPLFQYFRMPPPLHGGPINHEQPDYNRLSGSHKVICQSPKTKCNPLLSSQGHQNHCNNLFSFYGEGHQGQATYKLSCYQPLTRLNAATDLYTAHIQVKNKV